MGPTHSMPRPPASDELNSHPELSGCRSPRNGAHVGDEGRCTPFVYHVWSSYADNAGWYVWRRRFRI